MYCPYIDFTFTERSEVRGKQTRFTEQVSYQYNYFLCNNIKYT